MLDLVEQHPDGMSQPDIGDLLGVTRQRVQQIEARAVRRAGRLPRIAGVREAA
jgi:DNA-directed RNA polymerase sigma subunit (sigma70/sigma32)